MDDSTPTAKKVTRTKKVVSAEITSVPSDPQSISSTSQVTVTGNFEELIGKISKSKQEFDNLQKEIDGVKQDWVREQRQHESELSQQKTQEELERKREQETYQYETSLTRKRVEDEFNDKKLAWEKDLSQRKEELEVQKQEFEQLKKTVTSFESEKHQAVEEAQVEVENQLTEKFNQEKALREQEIKSEKEVLSLKISNLESENLRQSKEIEVLKRAFDEATKQVKEIAVKVIESGSSQQKAQVSSEA